MLLVLDNCEHVLTECADLVAAVLGQCQAVRILVTDRERLGVAGEVIWPVPVLSYPGAGPTYAPETLADHESIQLLLDRARLVHPAFEVSQDNAWAVAQLCQKLDGLPLAIELAAARLDALSIEDLLERLDDRLGLLTVGNRGSAPRQQTLRATVDWSHALLTEAERVLFRRLAVFGAGWTMAAAEAVCAGDGLLRTQIATLLANLVQKSLVLTDAQGPVTRYRFLETIRQYAREQLDLVAEGDDVHRRQVNWALRLVDWTPDGLVGPNVGERLDQFAAEQDNFRVALDWCARDLERLDMGVRLCAGLGQFWHWRGHTSEGREWMRRFLLVEGHRPLPPDLNALTLAALLEWRQGDTPAAMDLIGKALVQGEHRALRYAGYLALALGDEQRATRYAADAIKISQSAGRRRELAWSTCFLGLLCHLFGDAAEARARLQSALTVGRELRDPITISSILAHLGAVAIEDECADLAEQLFGEALDLASGIAFKLGTADALTGLGDVARLRHDAGTATRHYRQALDCYAQAGERRQMAVALERFASLLAQAGSWEAAAIMFGAGEAHFEITSGCLPPRPSHRHEKDVSTTQTALGPVAFARCWATGQAWTLEYAVARVT